MPTTASAANCGRSTAAASTTCRNSASPRKRCPSRCTGSSGRRTGRGCSGFALLVVMYYVHADMYMIDRSGRGPRPVAGGRHRVALLVGGLGVLRPAVQAARASTASVCSRRMVASSRRRVGAVARVQRPRDLHPGRRDAGNDHGRQCPRDHSVAAQAGRGEEQGIAPDPVYGRRGKQRSVHNNYFTLPVLFIMISNHYPMTCGHRTRGWCCSRSCSSRRTCAISSTCGTGAGRSGRFRSRLLGTLALAIVIAPRGRTSADRHVRRGAGDRRDALRDVPRREADAGGIHVAPKDVMLDTPGASAPMRRRSTSRRW